MVRIAKLKTLGITIGFCVAMVGGVAHAEAKPQKSNQGAPTAAVGVVNLNTATVDELMRLPGIGPKKAEAIMILRQKRKGFQKLQDILRVKGIGRKTFQRLQPMLALTGPTTLGTGSSSALQDNPSAQR